jgi:putative methionine-R-sulfoxide reductase with GAF domain
MATLPPTRTDYTNAGTIDRRLSLRHTVVQSHLITVDLDFQEGALLLDLGETGMSVQLVVDPPTKGTTTFRFELPDTGGGVTGVGRITRTEALGRLGIQFERLDEMSRLHLAEWLSSYLDPLITTGPIMALPNWPAPRSCDEVTALRRELATGHLTGDQALAFIVERVRNVTRATGTALALENGGQIVCRASSGNAPAVGVIVDPESGLSGECLRTGGVVRCDDTETEPRVDALVCRRVELRSIVIVPVLVQRRPAGVLEAFSPQSHAFNSGDELVLRRAADLVAEIAVPHTEPAPSQTAMVPATVESPVPEPQAAPGDRIWMDEILATVMNPEVAPPPIANTEQPADQPQQALSYLSRFVRRARVAKRPRNTRESSRR